MGDAAAVSKEPSVDYGTLQNEDFDYPTNPTPKTRMHPRLKVLLTLVATLMVVAVIVMLAVFGLSFENESGQPVTAESGSVQLPLNLTDRERAVAILSRVPLIDGHTDFFKILGQRIGNKLGAVDFSRDVTDQWGFSQIDIPRMRQGMLGAQLWDVYAPCTSQQKDALRQILEVIDTAKRFMARYSDTFSLVTTSQGILDTFEAGRIAGLLSMAGGHPIDSSLGTLRMLYDLGLRVMTLTHDCNTPWADCRVQSPNDPPDPIPNHGGLTEFGRTVVGEMNRLGVVIDVAHTSDLTILDVLETSSAPVLLSHTAAWSLCNASFHNTNDSMMQLIGEYHGLVMVTFVTAAVGCTLDILPAPTLSTVADHIEWIKEVVGADHIGIGATFDASSYYNRNNGTGVGPINPREMTGVEDVSTYPGVFTELAARGWTDEDLEKLAGGNFLRVFAAVEEERDRLSAVLGPIEDLVPPADVSNLPCRSDL